MVKLFGQAYEDLRGPFEVDDVDPATKVYSVIPRRIRR